MTLVTLMLGRKEVQLPLGYPYEIEVMDLVSLFGVQSNGLHLRFKENGVWKTLKPLGGILTIPEGVQSVLVVAVSDSQSQSQTDSPLQPISSTVSGGQRLRRGNAAATAYSTYSSLLNYGSRMVPSMKRKLTLPSTLPTIIKPHNNCF